MVKDMKNLNLKEEKVSQASTGLMPMKGVHNTSQRTASGHGIASVIRDVLDRVDYADGNIDITSTGWNPKTLGGIFQRLKAMGYRLGISHQGAPDSKDRKTFLEFWDHPLVENGKPKTTADGRIRTYVHPDGIPKTEKDEVE